MREKILHAAEKAIGNAGNDFTMDQLATAVGISKRTLYEHFRDKEEIVELILLSQLRDVVQQARAVTHDESLSVRECISTCVTLQSRSYPLITLPVKGQLLQKYPQIAYRIKSAAQAYWQELEAYLEGQQARHRIKKISVQAVIALMQVISHDYMYRRLVKREPLTEQDLLALLEIMFVGMIPDEPKEESR